MAGTETLVHGPWAIASRKSAPSDARRTNVGAFRALVSPGLEVIASQGVGEDQDDAPRRCLTLGQRSAARRSLGERRRAGGVAHRGSPPVPDPTVLVRHQGERDLGRAPSLLGEVDPKRMPDAGPRHGAPEDRLVADLDDESHRAPSMVPTWSSRRGCDGSATGKTIRSGARATTVSR